MPTIKRNGTSYLFDTLNNLLENMNEDEKNQTLIVISVGEINLEFVNSVKNEIKTKFSDDFSRGLIEIIAPLSSYYHPKMNKIRLTLRDDNKKVRWRSKENLDAAFLMTYAMTKGKYFAFIEDDVKTKPNFITKIHEFIQKSDKETRLNPWVMLKLCTLGSVATLFRSSDLPDIVTYLKIFYNDKPIDWLFDEFLGTRYCNYGSSERQCDKQRAKVKRFIDPSLFQHIGMFSSYPGKIQKLKDKNFK